MDTESIKMADNVELNKVADPGIGIEGQTAADDPLPDIKPKREKVPIAKIDRFYVNHQSLRDIEFSVKATTAFVVGSFIGYTSNYASTLSAIDSQYLIPVVAMMLIADTFGQTLLMSLVGILNFVPESIFLYVIQILGVGYEDYLSSTLLFFAVTFIIGFCNPNIAIRKVALLLPAINIATLVTTPPEYLTGNFIWVSLSGVLIGLSVSLAVSLVIFPRFACIEAQDRLGYSLSVGGEILQLISLALTSTNPAAAADFIYEAESVLELMKDNQLMINARVKSSILEPKGILRKYLRPYQPIFNRLPIPIVGEVSSSLLWHLQSALQAVKQIHFHEQHATAVIECRDAFTDCHVKFLEVTRLLAAQSSDQAHNEAAITAALNELSLSCDRVGPILAKALLKSGGSGTSVPSGQDQTQYNASVPESAIIDFDPMASNSNNGMTFAFYLFHVAEMIKLVKAKFGPSEGASAGEQASQKPPAKDTKPHVSLGTKLGIFFKRYGWEYSITGLRTSLILGVALIFVEVPILEKKFEHGIWILIASINAQNDNVGSTFSQIRLRLLGTMFGAIYSYFTFLAVGNTIWINLDGLKLDLTSTPSSAPTIVGSTLSPTVLSAPSIKPTRAPFAFGLNFDIGQIYNQVGMFIPFLLVCGVIRQNKHWSYFGTIASLTAVIVSFGRVSLINYPYEGNLVLGDYVVLLRIQENVIGILIVFLMSVLFVPILATDLLKFNIMDTLVKFTVAVMKSWSVYDRSIMSATETSPEVALETAGAAVGAETSAESPVTSEHAATDPVMKPSEELRAIDHYRFQSAQEHNLRVECEDIHNSLLIQETLIDNAALETLFWCQPFSVSIFQHLLRVENSLLALLFCFDRVSAIVSKLVHLKVAKYMIDTAIYLHKDFTQLTREVYYVIEECHKLTESALFLYPFKFHLSFPLPPGGTITHPFVPEKEETEVNHVSIYTENETVDPSELTRLLSSRDEFAQNPFSTTDTDNLPDGSILHLDAKQEKALQLRLRHRARLQELHRTISNITDKIGKVNDKMTVTWTNDILALVNSIGTAAEEKTGDSEGASIGRLMSIHTTFNAYFYSSAHFASSLEEMSNLIFTGTELNVKHQPF